MVRILTKYSILRVSIFNFASELRPQSVHICAFTCPSANGPHGLELTSPVESLWRRNLYCELSNIFCVCELERESVIETLLNLLKFARAMIESANVVQRLRAETQSILKNYVTKGHDNAPHTTSVFSILVCSKWYTSARFKG